MIDRMMMWEMSQIRRRDLLETARVAERPTGVHPGSAWDHLRRATYRLGRRLLDHGSRRLLDPRKDAEPLAGRQAHYLE
jgi:hypothetical protein